MTARHRPAPAGSHHVAPPSHRASGHLRLRRLAAPAAHVLVITAAVAAITVLLHRTGPMGQRALGPTVAQAIGFAALLWSYVALLLGLAVSTRPPGREAHRPNLAWRKDVVTVHRQLSVAVIALTLAHALTWALVSPDGSLLVALVPWAAAYQQLGYTLGVLGLYLAVILGPTYYLRRRIGRRTWLVAHQLVAVSYALSLWHSLFLGMDLRGQGLPRTLTWAAQIPLLVLLAVRLQRPLRRSDELDRVRRAGRFGERRDVVSRGVLVIGIAGTAAVVLVMALLAMSSGEHGTSILGLR